ncbi:hypothetical protein V8C43DRAFT_268113 [Trichoderma afarasin]
MQVSKLLLLPCSPRITTAQAALFQLAQVGVTLRNRPGCTDKPQPKGDERASQVSTETAFDQISLHVKRHPAAP